MKLRLVTLAFAATGFAAPVSAGITKANVYACKDPATTAADVKLRAKGDGKASADYERAKIASGDCTVILKDAPVSVDERKGPLFCVRPSGGLDCYWTAAAGVDEYGKPSQASANGGSAPNSGRRGRRH